MKHVLSIAGSDSSCGAGIQADLKSIYALGSYGLSVITAVTAQNTRGVKAIQEIEAEIVTAQLDAIFTDIRVDAVKIGMLSSAKLIDLISDYFSSLFQNKTAKYKYSKNNLPIVLDPVMTAKSGDRLLKLEAINELKTKLFPLARIITPNLPETEALLASRITNTTDMQNACSKLLQTGPDWVVVKGGHLPGEPFEVVANKDGIHLLKGKRVDTNNNHGTGCSFSSAIATFLAQGDDELTAIRKAKAYVQSALEEGFSIGEGVGIPWHFNQQAVIKSHQGRKNND